MVRFAEIIDGAHVERRLTAPAYLRGRLVVHLDADQQRLEHLLLEHGAHEAVVLETGTRVDAVAAPAVRRPRPPGLLQPDGQERVQAACAQTLRALPLGTSSNGKTPTIGMFLVSWTKRNFTPSSVSP